MTHNFLSSISFHWKVDNKPCNVLTTQNYQDLMKN